MKWHFNKPHVDLSCHNRKYGKYETTTNTECRWSQTEQHVEGKTTYEEINRPSFFAVGGLALLPLIQHLCFSLCVPLFPIKKGEILQLLTGCMFFLCIAQRTEIAAALVLHFLLFQAGALSQTTDVVLQSKIKPLLDEKPDSCACIIPDGAGKEKLQFECWYCREILFCQYKNNDLTYCYTVLSSTLLFRYCLQSLEWSSDPLYPPDVSLRYV